MIPRLPPERSARQSVGRLIALAAYLCLASVPAAADPLELLAGVSLTEEYNSNVFFSADDSDDDLITLLGLNLLLQYQRPQLNVSLNAGTFAQFFALGSQPNRVDLSRAQSLDLSTSYAWSSRLSFSFFDTLARVDNVRTATAEPTNSGVPTGGNPTTPTDPNAPQQPPAQPPPQQAPDDPGTQKIGNFEILLPRGSAFTNTAAIATNYLLTEQWSTGVGYTNTLSIYQDPDATDIWHNGNARFSYAWDPTLTFNNRWAYSYFQLDSTPGSDSSAATVTLGGDYIPNSLWALGLDMGAFVNFGDDTDNSFTQSIGFAGDAQVTRTSDRSQASLRARQGVTPSLGIGGVSVTRQIATDYSYRIYEQIFATISGSYGHYDTTTDDFHLLLLSTGVTFPIWRDFYGRLFYTYRWRDSNVVEDPNTGQPDPNATFLGEGVVQGHAVAFQVGYAFSLWRWDI